VSRLTGYRPTTLGLEEAFRLLGGGPSHERLAWVADRLRESGVEVYYDDESIALAEANGSSGLVALDLQAAYHFGVGSLRQCEPRHSRSNP
jgi:hypothetical protein